MKEEEALNATLVLVLSYFLFFVSFLQPLELYLSTLICTQRHFLSLLIMCFPPNLIVLNCTYNQLLSLKEQFNHGHTAQKLPSSYNMNTLQQRLNHCPQG